MDSILLMITLAFVHRSVAEVVPCLFGEPCSCLDTAPTPGEGCTLKSVCFHILDHLLTHRHLSYSCGWGVDVCKGQTLTYDTQNPFQKNTKTHSDKYIQTTDVDQAVHVTYYALPRTHALKKQSSMPPPLQMFFSLVQGIMHAKIN